MFQQWINFILGIWLIVSAYISWTSSGLTANLLVVGIVVAILALWGALQYGTASTRMRQSHT